MQFNLQIRILILTIFLLLPFIFPNTSASQVFTKITDVNNPIVSDPVSGQYIGASWVDIDNDGFLDLYVSGKQIYKNLGNGNFIRLANSFPPLGPVIGNSWADYDNDGFIDCFLVGNLQGNPASFLYRNNGNGTFTKILTGAIADSNGNSGWGCAWGDYNNDGYPDLVIAAASGFGGVNHPNRLFLNNGNGTFTRIDTTAITAVTGPYTIPVWSDYDQDGDIDLFIGSGPATGTPARDYLYRNFESELSVPFLKRIDSTVIGTDLVDGQNWNWIDYDNDGDLDAFLTNYSTNIPNVLYRCDGLRQYTKMTTAQVGDIVSYHPGLSLANVWGDFDNDGDLDCIITNDAGARNWYYRNNGNGTFTRDDTLSIVTGPGPHYGITVGDYDDNGTLDVYVAGNNSTKGLFRNDTQNGNKWVNIKCQGAGPSAGSNKSALGTIVKAKSIINGVPRWQIREINAQNSFNSMNMLNVHFGFGNAAIIDTLVIKWPRGLVQTFTNVNINKFYNVTEGGPLNEVVIGIKQIGNSVPKQFKLSQNYPNPFNPSTKIKFEIPRASLVTLKIFDINGKLIETLLNEKNINAGTFETEWDAAKYSSGIYFYRLTAGSFTQTRKMILVK